MDPYESCLWAIMHAFRAYFKRSWRGHCDDISAAERGHYLRRSTPAVSRASCCHLVSFASADPASHNGEPLDLCSEMIHACPVSAGCHPTLTLL